MLLSGIKNAVPEANITHLGHASMVLALLRANPLPLTAPPSAQTSTLYSPCWVNGRRYLKSSFHGHSQAGKSYTLICQSFAPIIFPDLQLLTLSHNSTPGNIRETLINTCKVAVTGYGELRKRLSVLPESVALMEYLGEEMFRCVFPKPMLSFTASILNVISLHAFLPFQSPNIESMRTYESRNKQKDLQLGAEQLEVASALELQTSTTHPADSNQQPPGLGQEIKSPAQNKSDNVRTSDPVSKLYLDFIYLDN